MNLGQRTTLSGHDGPSRRSTVNPLQKALRLLARPARTAGGRGGAIIQTYNGCGSQDEVFLIGRVLRQPRFGLGKRADALERDLVDLLRRFLRRGMPGAVIEARLDEATIVELTALIAFQNMSSKFNSALAIPQQGFCTLPEAAGERTAPAAHAP